jgi:hypothetical protein
MKRNASRITFSAMIVLLLLESTGEAQPPQHSKILSITMRLQNDVLLLENTEVVNGTLKTEAIVSKLSFICSANSGLNMNNTMMVPIIGGPR